MSKETETTNEQRLAELVAATGGEVVVDGTAIGQDIRDGIVRKLALREATERRSLTDAEVREIREMGEAEDA